jgi:hypothetical protein
MPDAVKSPVVFVKENRELRTISDYFKEAQTPVVGIRWEENVKKGSTIHAGQALGNIVWAGNEKGTPIYSPPGCAGCIEFKNGNLPYEWFHKNSYLLFRLA